MKSLIVLLLLFMPYLANSQIRIGVLSNRGDEVVYRTWNESKDYLQKELRKPISIIPLKFDEIRTAIDTKKIDYIFMNPMLYVQNEHRYHIKKVLTTRRYYNNRAQPTFGSVIFVRSGTLIPKVKLQNISVSAVHPQSFGGWLVGRYVLDKEGITIPKSNVHFKYDHYAVVQDILLGKSELGIVRTGVLEELMAKGMLNQDSIKILFPKTNTPYQFLSSNLYPSWPIAALPHVQEREKAELALALLKISVLKPKYTKRIGFEWGLPDDYSKVSELLRYFKVYPFDYSESITLSEIYRRNRVGVYITALVIVSLFFLLVFGYFDRQQKLRFHTIIRKERDELKRFVEILPAPIILLDHEFFIIRTNIAFSQLVSIKESEILGKRLKDFIGGINRDEFIKKLIEKGDFKYTEDLYIVDSRERLIPVAVEAFSYRFEDEPISVVTVKDMSSQKELTKLQKEWEMRRYEEEKVRSVGILGSGVAHEINNPLTIISSSTKVLQKYLNAELYDKKKWNRMLDDIYVAGTRISDIVNALRLLGRSEQESPEDYQEIGNFFETALVLVSSKLIAKGIPVHFNYKHVKDKAYYSHAKMHQYLVNILLNAERIVEKLEEKWIRIEVGVVDDSFFSIRISNSGPKIDEKIIDNIFIPFATSEQVVTGKGMSLAQTKSYLNERHGDIWVDREAPHTTFVIKYPFDHRQIA